MDCRASNSTPSKGNGLGNANGTCRSFLGENKLRARLRMALTDIRAVRKAVASESALAKNECFHSCTFAGVISAKLIA